jgi:hypothetical protein
MTLEEELGELRTTAWHQKPEIAADATQTKSEVIEEGIYPAAAMKMAAPEEPPMRASAVSEKDCRPAD